MLKYAYFAFLFTSIVASLVSAYYWHEASKVAVDLSFLDMPPGQEPSPVVVLPVQILKAGSTAYANTQAFRGSGYLNKKAAGYAAIAAVGVAGYSICSYFIGCCQ